MFSIGEFSMMSGIPVRTLRFYHEAGVLVPSAVDPQSKYRSYDERNLETASIIVALRGLEFTLDEIREILADCSEDVDIVAHLARQKAMLGSKLRHYQDVVKNIDRIIQAQLQLREEEKMSAQTYEIGERQLNPMLVAGIRMQGFYRDCGKGFATLFKRLGRHVAGKPLCLFYDGEYREGDANFETCVPIRKAVTVDGISVRELPASRILTLKHRGPYEELKNSYARILRYAKKRDYNIELPTCEVYLKGPGMIFRGNPRKYVTEIQLPIAG